MKVILTQDVKSLGKKGELTALMEEFKTVAPELKRDLGQQLNRLKNEATERINTLREQLQNAAADLSLIHISEPTRH